MSLISGFHDGQTFTPLNHHQGFTTIKPGTSLHFDMPGGDQQIVFVAIRCGSKIIADDYPIAVNFGIIVDECGYVRRADDGNNDHWMDEQGKIYPH